MGQVGGGGGFEEDGGGPIVDQREIETPSFFLLLLPLFSFFPRSTRDEPQKNIWKTN